MFLGGAVVKRISRLFKNPIPAEISEMCLKVGMTEQEIQKLWDSRYNLGDNYVIRLSKLYKTSREEALTLVDMECARREDYNEIRSGMANFIKEFPDMELAKWNIQEVSLVKLWMAGDSIRMAIRSLIRRGLGKSFTISSDGLAFNTETKAAQLYNAIGDISLFIEVDLRIAEKILTWLINASRYDSKNLFFKDLKSSYESTEGTSYLILS